jgi:hypothetical protein
MAPVLHTARIFISVLCSVYLRRLQCVQSMLNIILAVGVELSMKAYSYRAAAKLDRWCPKVVRGGRGREGEERSVSECEGVKDAVLDVHTMKI